MGQIRAMGFHELTPGTKLDQQTTLEPKSHTTISFTFCHVGVWCFDVMGAILAPGKAGEPWAPAGALQPLQKCHTVPLAARFLAVDCSSTWIVKEIAEKGIGIIPPSGSLFHQRPIFVRKSKVYRLYSLYIGYTFWFVSVFVFITYVGVHFFRVPAWDVGFIHYAPGQAGHRHTYLLCRWVFLIVSLRGTAFQLALFSVIGEIWKGCGGRLTDLLYLPLCFAVVVFSFSFFASARTQEPQNTTKYSYICISIIVMSFSYFYFVFQSWDTLVLPFLPEPSSWISFHPWRSRYSL